MNKEEIVKSFVLLDFEIEKNPKVQDNLASMFTMHLQNKSLGDLLSLISKLYSDDISRALFEGLRAPTRTLKILETENLKFLKFYQFLFLTYRDAFVKARAFESNGPCSLLKIGETISESSIRFQFIRADDQNFEIEIPDENILDVISYFSQSFDKYLNKRDVDPSDLKYFLSDMKALKENFTTLEETLQNKYEALQTEIDEKVEADESEQ
ncbi:hypothetical protein ACX163_19120 [Bacillus cereus]